MRLKENYRFIHHYINAKSCCYGVLMASNQIAYLKNNLMKVLACMKEDEDDFIKYSRIESEKNAIVTLSQPSPKSLSIENTSNMLFKSEVIQSSICTDDT